MTDHLDPLDELASAHLDGLTTPDEAAQVAASAELQARVARLAAARAAVREDTPALDAGRREAAIAAALAAYDADTADHAIEGAARATVPLTPAGRWSASRRRLQLVGVAAAVLFAALLVPLLGRLDSGPDEDTAASSADAGGEERSDLSAGAGGAGGAGTEAADSALSEQLAAPGVARLGPVADLDELAVAVRRALDDDTGAAASAPASDTEKDAARYSACAVEGPPGDPEVYRAVAEVGGTPVLVVVRSDSAGRPTMTVIDEGCDTITVRPL